MKCSKDFIVSYNKLFAFLESKDALDEFWPILSDAILTRLRHLVRDKGFLGMLEYWSDTLMSEHADCKLEVDLVQRNFTIYMEECPSLKCLGDSVMHGYCFHCDKIYGPLLKELGYGFRVYGVNRGCEIFIEELK